MKRVFILILFVIPVFLIAQGFENKSTITEDLKLEISQRLDSDLIPVTIVLSDEYPTNQLRSTYNNMTKTERKKLVIQELKSFSENSQQNIKETLEIEEGAGNIVIEHYFWITNAIKCKAKPEIINQLAKRDDVKRINFDKETYALFDEQSTEVESNSTREITYNVLKVNAPDVWAEGYTGEGVIVAVLDVGVNYNHADLSSHMWESADYPYHGYDFAYNDNNPMDNHGHGTHCAGTVAGDGTAGSQTGMAPGATIMALKVLNDNGGGVESATWQAIEFAVDNGADVLSMSIGWMHSSNPDRVTWRNTMNNALAAGVVASVAAGNDYGSITNPDDVRTPGDCPPPWLNPDQTLTGGISAVVCVGATNSNDNIAAFSSRGPSSWENVNPFNDYPFNPEIGLLRPDVSAPGVDVKSCNAFNVNGYTTMSGTSMATPGVAGVMALLLSKNSNLTPEMIDQLLETTAIDLGSVGKDNMYGAGRIDAYQALINAIDIYAPTALNAATDQETGLCTLTWNHYETDAFEYFRIYRDNVIIDSTTELTITDQLTDIGYYMYSVTAFYGGNMESDAAIKQTQFGSSTIVANPNPFSVNIRPDSVIEREVVIRNEGILDLTFLLSPLPPLASWLSIDPESGEVPIGDSIIITLALDATDLENGVYSTQAPLRTNDIESVLYFIDVNMAVTNLEVDAGVSSDEICIGFSAQLESLVSGGTGTYTYQWSSEPAGFYSEEPNPIIFPEVNTNYFLTVNDGIVSVESSVYVNVLETPHVDLGGDQIVCGENSIDLDAGNQGDSYLWSTDETSQTITATGDGNTLFWVQVTNANNCSTRDTIYINFAELPYINLGNDTLICGGETLTLNAGNQGAQYIWSTGTNEQTYIADTLGFGLGVQNISVEVTSEVGCKNDAGISVEFIDCASINEITGVEFSIYPVPTEGLVNIKFSGNTNHPLEVRVYDLSGKEVFIISDIAVSGVTIKRADLSGLAKGAYTIIVSDGRSKIADKILIK